MHNTWIRNTSISQTQSLYSGWYKWGCSHKTEGITEDGFFFGGGGEIFWFYRLRWYPTSRYCRVPSLRWRWPITMIPHKLKFSFCLQPEESNSVIGTDIKWNTDCPNTGEGVSTTRRHHTLVYSWGERETNVTGRWGTPCGESSRLTGGLGHSFWESVWDQVHHVATAKGTVTWLQTWHAKTFCFGLPVLCSDYLCSGHHWCSFLEQAKYLAQIIVTGATIIGRAFTRALRQEIQASQQAAKARQSSRESSRTAAQNAISGMNLQVCFTKQ